jgi:GDPmannose 4,6-dehydratase
VPLPSWALAGASTSEGEKEIGVVAHVRGGRAKAKFGDLIEKVDPRYFRPSDVETLLGDPSKAKQKLGRVPPTNFQELVNEMIENDYTSPKRDSLIKSARFQAYDYHE